MLNVITFEVSLYISTMKKVFNNKKQSDEDSYSLILLLIKLINKFCAFNKILKLQNFCLRILPKFLEVKWNDLAGPDQSGKTLLWLTLVVHDLEHIGKALVISPVSFVHDIIVSIYLKLLKSNTISVKKRYVKQLL